MKILFVNCFYWPDLAGGAERSVKRLVDLHIKAGDEVSVLTTHAGSDVKIEEIDGARVFRIPPNNIYWAKQPDTPNSWKRLLWHSIDSFNPLSYRDALKVIREVTPDVVSCHNLAGLSASIWAATQKLKIPTVQVLRDYYTICPKSTMNRNGHNCEKVCGSCAMFRVPHKILANKLHAVVGCSQAVLNKHLRFGLYARVAVKEVIYNAESISPKHKDSRDPNRAFTFGYIGALTEVKGIDKMIQAFIEAEPHCNQPVRLIVAGTGPESYVNELKRSFTAKNISFIGHTKPASLFEMSDITIAPSIWDDPLPGVVFQALSHGVPVIGSNRGGIPEMVTDGYNGILYDPTNPFDLKNAMTRIANDSNLHRWLTGNTIQSSEKFLDEDRLIKEYMSVYQRVTQNAT